MRLEGKIALVTGASQGIGKAIAIAMAEEGADVVLDYHGQESEADALAVKKEIDGLGRKCLAIAADISKLDQVSNLVRHSLSEMGGLDILVNNAGVEKRAPAWEVTEADFDLVLAVNLKGVFFVSQGFIKYWMENKRPGKIINISSVHEELPFPHFSAYCMSKGGLKMMTRNLAIEVAPYGITVNSIAPGAIETPINRKLLNDQEKLAALLGNIPLGRLGNTHDVAGVAVFLSSSDSDYITGTTIFVDGGLLWNYQEQ
jgi:glucose 1-dehydrogenase